MMKSEGIAMCIHKCMECISGGGGGGGGNGSSVVDALMLSEMCAGLRRSRWRGMRSLEAA